MTVRVIDHRRARTYRLARFFGNHGHDPVAFAPPAALFLPYAALNQFWWFLSWHAVVLACLAYVLCFFGYAVAVQRAKLEVEVRHDTPAARSLVRVQLVQEAYFELPPELRSSLEDTLAYCYRALRLGEHSVIETRQRASAELLTAYRESQRLVLEGSDDLERVRAVTKALQESSSTKAVQAA